MVARAMADFIISNKLIEKVSGERKISLVNKLNMNMNPGVKDVLFAKTIRMAAKSFFMTMPFEKFKKKQLKGLRKKNDADFNRRYAKFYGEIEGTGLESIFNLPLDFSKEAAISRVESLTREEVLQAIDEIPDYAIVYKVQEYFNKSKKKEGQKQDIVEWLNGVFKKMNAKIAKED